ncbi:hypothetical protein BTO04_13125 [Polaribacter sp. SA4-10]|uniref:LytTR family transcriptional regulator DNA-binding domain-containing protein n=1 Tax=Polaribacter sp. SA4-10 TaxID=754397 RepID=UPI000B3CD2A9|nr:LytTR family transcriptional regulator DNA-binding domain-containing protein [Polaribacter sp. SA4-10]ARV07573.1 hypothetical protein BTO04_13125 [Polaribacter sp. SA4-10]
MVKIIFDETHIHKTFQGILKIIYKIIRIVKGETIRIIETKLPNKSFSRIHRSYIVNLNKVNSNTNALVEIEKNAMQINRAYKENVLKKLAEI